MTQTVSHVATAEMLLRSRHLSYFQQHGEVYAFHNLFGYILKMSADLAELLEFHRELRTREEVDAEFGDHFETEQLDEFMGVFKLFSCLIESEVAEERSLWMMVPVRARWVVYHQPAESELTFWRTDRDGKSSADPQPAWAARLWQRIDNTKTLRTLYDEIKDGASLAGLEKPEKQVLETLTRWVASDRQYLKFAKAPVWKFGKEHQWPSYLKSTMPYAPWQPGTPLPPNPLEKVAEPLAPPHGYYEGEIMDAERQFRETETTLSHLLREPHSLLGGATFSQRVAEALSKLGALDGTTRRIVEVGGGLGHVAAGVLAWIRDTLPDAYGTLEYTIVDVSPVLRAAQEKLLTERGVADRVRWMAVNAETLDLPDASVDLLLSNEVVGDFTTVKLTRALLGLDGEKAQPEAFADWSPDTRAKLGAAGEQLLRYQPVLRDAPDEIYFNTGAIAFLERVAKALRPGGAAFITEYGDVVRYPIPGTHLDHLEFSIHFGHLVTVARGLGLEADVKYLQDLIGLDRNAYTLTTTRTYFASMRAMLASFGVEFDKIAYTREMFQDALEGHVPFAAIGDVRFSVVDERCMGLSPHEFKALILKRPASAPPV